MIPWYNWFLYSPYNNTKSLLVKLRGVVRMSSNKRNIYKEYIEIFKNTSICFQQIPNNCYSSYHIFPILLENANSKKEIFDNLYKANIGVNVHYMPIYLHPYYSRLGFKPGYCKNAEEYYKKTISIPLFQNMTDNDITYVIDTLMDLYVKCLHNV